MRTSLDPGTCLGKYLVLAHIGTGGMGKVYKARDTELDRLVALKVLAGEQATKPARKERFRREARHAAQLLHKNIVTLYDWGQIEDTFYLALEYVDGMDLEEYIIRKGKLKPDLSRYLLIQATRALDHAYRRNIIHRDLKPSNFLLARQEGRLLVKMTDFGLARTVDDDQYRVTRAGSTVGSVDYLSPEQARDSAGVDIRSDIYSLGCTLYHMLAGAPPFSEGGLGERVYKHLTVDPADIRSLNPDVPEGLWWVLQKMLAKNPEDRYQTPNEVKQALKELPTSPPFEQQTSSEDTPGAPQQPASVTDSPWRDEKTLAPLAAGNERSGWDARNGGKARADVARKSPSSDGGDSWEMASDMGISPEEIPTKETIAVPKRGEPSWKGEPKSPPGPGDSSQGLFESPSSVSLTDEIHIDERDKPQAPLNVASGQFQRAIEAGQNGNLDYALELLLSCCRLDPLHIPYREKLRQMARVRKRKAGWFAMVGNLTSRTRLKSTFRKENYRKVLEDGEKILMSHPDDLSVHLLMVEAASEFGCDALALWLLEQARQHTTNPSELDRTLARIYEKQEDFHKALAVWERVAKANPHDVTLAEKIRTLAVKATLHRGNYRISRS